MKSLFLNSLFCFFTTLLLAQQPFYKSYEWDEKPEFSVNQDSDESIISLKNKKVVEFYFEKNDDFVEYYLEHRAYWLNSDDQIEKFNKVYIPHSNTSKIEVNKARVITKDGKTLELDKSKILTAEDEETKQQYKYFAFEGVEKGSIIEFYYVVKKEPGYSGKKINFQSDYQSNDISFDLYSPVNLVFDFKSYNEFKEIEFDTTSLEKLHWKLEADSIEPLIEEDFSAYRTALKSLVYKLDRNTATNANDISSYSSVAQRVHSYYNAELSKKTVNAVEKFIKTATKQADEDISSQIRALEFYVKNNFYLTEGNSEELADIDFVLKNKVCSEGGLIKLLIACFKAMDISYEMVITSDRFELKFDKDFEANNFLNDFLFYFPKTKAYMSPKEIESRYGYPPPRLTDNYGLFIKEVNIGDFKSALGKVKYIKPVKAENNYDKMIVDVSFDEADITKTKVHLDKSMNGYYAMYYHPFLHLVKEEDKTELIESFAKNLNENVTITKKEIVNEDPKLFGVKPLQVLLEFDSDAFVEKAGNRYLFKLGELIGPQTQLYQEKERKLPVESEFQRSYFRTLTIQIPEGYKILNLDDINIDNSYSQDGEELLSFKSFYELNGNTLTVTADEHYRVNILETELYEEYRKVINSAADFNKITLVLVPNE